MDIVLEITLVGVIALAVSAYCFYKAYGLKKRGSDRYKIVSLGVIALILLVIGLGIFSYGILLISDPPKLQPGLNDRIPVPNASIQLGPGFDDNGVLELRVKNTGSNTVNLSRYDIQYGPPNFDPVVYRVIERHASNWTASGDGNRCFTSGMVDDPSINDTVLETGEKLRCSTGIKFPDKLESVEIDVEASSFDYSNNYDCSVASSNTTKC